MSCWQRPDGIVLHATTRPATAALPACAGTSLRARSTAIDQGKRAFREGDSHPHRRAAYLSAHARGQPPQADPARGRGRGSAWEELSGSAHTMHLQHRCPVWRARPSAQPGVRVPPHHTGARRPLLLAAPGASRGQVLLIAEDVAKTHDGDKQLFQALTFSVVCVAPGPEEPLRWLLPPCFEQTEQTARAATACAGLGTSWPSLGRTAAASPRCSR